MYMFAWRWYINKKWNPGNHRTTQTVAPGEHGPTSGYAHPWFGAWCCWARAWEYPEIRTKGRRWWSWFKGSWGAHKVSLACMVINWVNGLVKTHSQLTCCNNHDDRWRQIPKQPIYKYNRILYPTIPSRYLQVASTAPAPTPSMNAADGSGLPKKAPQRTRQELTWEDIQWHDVIMCISSLETHYSFWYHDMNCMDHFWWTTVSFH